MEYGVESTRWWVAGIERRVERVDREVELTSLVRRDEWRTRGSYLV